MLLKGAINMSKDTLHTKAIDFLLKTSRTFFIPISHLPGELQDTVGAAYLCMRAIDEIEDHPELPSEVKIKLLTELSKLLQEDVSKESIETLFEPYHSLLPEVTLLLHDWISLCPDSIQEKVLESTAIMAGGMAKWTEKNWEIKSVEDLDEYTYYVAGLVGVMLTDIWKWYDETEADKELAVAFGRGLQAVNILRNKGEDSERGVNFYPKGWGFEEMLVYTQKNLSLADTYLTEIKSQVVRDFCNIPLALAHGTLKALLEGREKINRTEVNEIVDNAINK